MNVVLAPYKILFCTTLSASYMHVHRKFLDKA
ncbi:uncharacterized protein METZ01_LOCUS501560, partial [marine metagenome]